MSNVKRDELEERMKKFEVYMEESKKEKEESTRRGVEILSKDISVDDIKDSDMNVSEVGRMLTLAEIIKISDNKENNHSNPHRYTRENNHSNPKIYLRENSERWKEETGIVPCR